jgi:hypothetical protein
MKSACCRGRVVVPVDVTAHVIVNADGSLSERLSDTMRGIRWAATRGGGADIEEAYCEECGASVASTRLDTTTAVV